MKVEKRSKEHVKMFVTKQIESEHKDLIHDVSFDFYGKRMASCSSDQSVKVRFLKITDLELFSGIDGTIFIHILLILIFLRIKPVFEYCHNDLTFLFCVITS